MAIHLPVGGSTIKRTIKCPAWISRAATLNTRPKSSAVADLGNLLHDAMEQRYLRDVSFQKLIDEGLEFAGITLAAEHLEILEMMEQATEAALDQYDVDQMILEPFVQWVPDLAGGSIDLLGFSTDGKTAVCLDYKTGRGAVGVKGNQQLMFYLLCAMRDPKTSDLFKNVERYVCVIIQPHIHGTKPDIWETDDAHLQAFADTVDDAIAAATGDNPEAFAGRHCMFCPFEPYCKEKRDKAASALTLDPSKQKSLNESIALAMELKPWIDAVLAEATEKATQGVRFPDFKLVAGRATRKWVDPEAAAETLKLLAGDFAFERKLVSPAGADKLVKQGLFAKDALPEIGKSAGEPKLVERSAKGEEIIPASAADTLKNALDNISDKA